MNSEAGNNQRRNERRVLRRPAQMQLQDGQVLQALARDIGLGGIGLIIPANLRPRAPCVVRLVLPQAKGAAAELTVRGVVNYSVYSGAEGGFLAGVVFAALDEAAATAIQDFLKRP